MKNQTPFSAAEFVKSHGRAGDTDLIHVSKPEVDALRGIAAAAGTSLTRNPHTGLPEAFNLFDILPIALQFIPGIGTAAGIALSAASGAASAAVEGNDPLQGGLMGGITGGIGAALKPAAAAATAATTTATPGIGGAFNAQANAAQAIAAQEAASRAAALAGNAGAGGAFNAEANAAQSAAAVPTGGFNADISAAQAAAMAPPTPAAETGWDRWLKDPLASEQLPYTGAGAMMLAGLADSMGQPKEKKTEEEKGPDEQFASYSRQSTLQRPGSDYDPGISGEFNYFPNYNPDYGSQYNPRGFAVGGSVTGNPALDAILSQRMTDSASTKEIGGSPSNPFARGKAGGAGGKKGGASGAANVPDLASLMRSLTPRTITPTDPSTLFTHNTAAPVTPTPTTMPTFTAPSNFTPPNTAANLAAARPPSTGFNMGGSVMDRAFPMTGYATGGEVANPYDDNSGDNHESFLEKLLSFSPIGMLLGMGNHGAKPKDAWAQGYKAGQPTQVMNQQTPRMGYAEGGGISAGMPQPGTGGMSSQDDQLVVKAAILAIQGQSPNPEAAIQVFVQRFGQAALQDLIARVKGQPGQQASSPQPGRQVMGPGDGLNDGVPAQIDGQQPAALSSGEFVVPSDAVNHLGNGSNDAGSSRLHDMISKLRQARTGSNGAPPAINPQEMLPA